MSVFHARRDEIANHGLRWIHHEPMPEAAERNQIRQATQRLQQLAGVDWTGGWYTGCDSPNTRCLVVDQKCYEYDSDYYGDDLPFWLNVRRTAGVLAPHLVIPYSLDTNDMRFVQTQGFNTGEHFFTYLRDTFDTLYAEGETSPRMMSVGMHCRLLGRPGRISALRRFLDYVQAQECVWICRRHRHRAALEGSASVRSGSRLHVGVTC